MNIFCDKGNQTHIVVSRSGSGTVINYGSGSDFLTSYGSDFGSGSTSQKVTVPMVPVPQRCPNGNSANQNGGGGEGLIAPLKSESVTGIGFILENPLGTNSIVPDP